MPPNDVPEWLIQKALEEDLGEEGDLTSHYFVPPEAEGRARIFAKQPGGLVLSGGRLAHRVFDVVDPGLSVDLVQGDGSGLEPGDTVLQVYGSLASILTAERTALNFLQRLSGIATLTRCYVQAVEGSGTRILDTRKTTPGWRQLEKMAVAHGGGTNHRMGLFDAIMVKDNHLLTEDRAEAIMQAITRVRKDHPDIRIQLEVDTLEQLDAYLALKGVDAILLDNMSLDQLRQAKARRDQERPSLNLEASGGVTLETVGDIAATGVDFISVGALTHSAAAVDLSLEILDTRG